MSQSGPIRILLIDDDEDDAFLTGDYLGDIATFELTHQWVGTFEEGLAALTDGAYDLCFLDYLLGDRSGLDLLRDACDRGCRLPVVMLTGKGDQRTAVEVMKAGAADYMAKEDLSTESLERTIRLVTEGAAARKDLERQRRRQRLIFEQSMDSILIAGVDGDLKDYNPTFEKEYLGQGKGDWRLSDLFVDQADLRGFQETMASQPRLENGLFELRKADGSVAEALLSAARILEDEDRAYMIMVRDISQFRKAEKELEVAERIRMTARLARGLAHEVRNPLTNIQLALQFLKGELPELTDELSGYTDIIERNHRRINDLITELLTSTTPAPLDLQPGDLGEVLDQSLELVQDRIALKGVNLTRHNGDHLPLVQLDAEKLQLAFTNILVNAVEAMETIEHPKLFLETGTDSSGVWVRVTDNGVGMDKEMRKNLFEMFYTQKKTGIGLGMVVTRNILQGHKARIGVDSTPGKGTTFTLTFPPH